VRDNTGDSGMVFRAFLTFFRDFSYKFCFTNGFQVFRPLSPVTGTALYKDCFFDIVSGTGVSPQAFQHVIKPSALSAPSPKVMMRIDNFTLRIDDFFLHLIEPFSTAWVMICHSLHLVCYHDEKFYVDRQTKEHRSKYMPLLK
jgi:hypothetical protein